MSLIQGLWVFSTLMSNVAVLLMMMNYKKMRTSLALIALRINEMSWDVRLSQFQSIGSENGTGISSMAEDTEVAE